MDDDVGPLRLALDRDLHPLDEVTHDDPPIRGRRRRRPPKRRDVRGERHDHVTIAGRQLGRLLVPVSGRIAPPPRVPPARACSQRRSSSRATSRFSGSTA